MLMSSWRLWVMYGAFDWDVDEETTQQARKWRHHLLYATEEGPSAK
jgi:hypothetical protein